MSDLSVTQAAGPFLLDGRSLEERLEGVRRYCAHMPFGDSGRSWAEVLFAGGVDPAALARAYASPLQADGEMLAHQSLLLAFLRMLETPRALLNALPAAHRQLYYHDLLGQRERPSLPDRVAVSFTLSEDCPELLLPAGALLDAGQDSQGAPRRYSLERALLANQGRCTDLRWRQPAANGGASQVARIVHDLHNGLPWPDQGVRLFGYDAEQDSPVLTGRVLSSPLLALGGGTRTITVTFAAQVDAAKISAQASSTDGWLDLTCAPGAAKQLTLTLAATAGPMTPAPGLDGFSAAAPLLRLCRADGQPVPAISKLHVAVQGLPDVLFSTDDGPADIDDRSFPFGVEPVVGAGFNLASADWCGKPGEITVTLTPQWLGLPAESFKKHYEGYKSPPENNAFQVQARLNTAGGAQAPIGTAAALFGSADTGVPPGNTVAIKITSFPGAIGNSSDPKDWQAWLSLDLQGDDFRHKDYWSLLAQGKTVKPPYTPELKQLRVDYSCETDKLDEQYELTPFGYRRAEAAADQPAAELYLGFSALQPGQDIALHWQLYSPQPLAPSWEYLDRSNRWRALQATVSDDTGGLFRSGLWRAVLPADAAADAPWMPAGRHWIRAVFAPPQPTASAAQDASGYPWLYGLHGNSAMAVLADGDTLEPAHFEQPLPPHSISQLLQPPEGLLQVEQPWPSSGGRRAEPAAAFAQRVARQLSHRGRALTWRDMRTLLLERYPEVYDARLAARESPTPAQHVLPLVVVPAHGRADNAEPLRPAFNPARLDDMRAYLQGLTSPWAELDLRNPDYVDVKLAYELLFAPGVNPDYGRRQVQRALERRYMPWSWDGASPVALGVQLDYYRLLAFIQDLAFVRQVTCLTLDGKHASVNGGATQVLILRFPESDQSSALADSQS